MSIGLLTSSSVCRHNCRDDTASNLCCFNELVCCDLESSYPFLCLPPQAVDIDDDIDDVNDIDDDNDIDDIDRAQEEHLNAVCSFLHEAPQHTGSGLPTVAEAAVGGRRNVSELPAWGFSIPVFGSRTTGTGICSGPGTSSPTLDL